MQLVNLDNLTVIGQGSEWFWAMAQFIIVAVTLGAVYLQVRSQGTATALQKMEFFVERWDSDKMTHDRLTTALQLKHGEAGDGMEPSMVAIADFWETLAQLEKSGHVSQADVWVLGRSLEMWWGLMASAIRAERLRQKSGFYGEWERLNLAMHQMDAKIGERYVLDATTIPGILDDVIRINTAMLRRSHDVASGVIPTAPAANEAEPPVPSPSGDAAQVAAGSRLLD